MISPITINFDEITEIAKVGVNRAYIFMGFAVNMSLNPHFSDFEVSDSPNLLLVSQNISDSERHEFKGEFANWAIANGLRDLNEYFEVFLDQIYNCALIIESWSIQSAGGEFDNSRNALRVNKFQKIGMVEKFKVLEKELSISIKFAEELLSIKRARNCLTHRLGIVDSKDLTDDNCMIISWRILELYGYEPDGSEYIPPQDKFPMKFPENSPVKRRFVIQKKSILLGERIIFYPTELKEICLTHLIAIDQVKDSFITFAMQKGVILNYTDKS